MFDKTGQILGQKYGIPVLTFYSSFLVYLPNKFDKETLPIMNVPLTDFASPLTDIEKLYNLRVESFKDLISVTDINVSVAPPFWGDFCFPAQNKEKDLYIGPGFRDEVLSQEDINFLQSLENKPNIIYACLGTSFADAQNFWLFDKLIEAFRNHEEYTIVISALEFKAKELSAQCLPKHIIVKSYVPQISLLRKAKLFFSHAGMGGVMEALISGVPIVGFPWGADQIVNTNVIEVSGVGKRLVDTSVEGVYKTITEVMENQEFRANAKKYSEMINPELSRKRFYELVKSNLKQ
eukprot:TRINITY_DN4305_c0_g2_i1.p1 TRINITY_DN4305_c0_g2~~TRINITY_DN4305_c0_g2_i1.p1  ORF type:complete len:293 (+),score=16.81 TRINITY_DN4305_c0_g2_i1:381-1259(+)